MCWIQFINSKHQKKFAKRLNFQLETNYHLNLSTFFNTFFKYHAPFQLNLHTSKEESSKFSTRSYPSLF